jgi:hypothetical protein
LRSISTGWVEAYWLASPSVSFPVSRARRANRLTDSRFRLATRDRSRVVFLHQRNPGPLDSEVFPLPAGPRGLFTPHELSPLGLVPLQSVPPQIGIPWIGLWPNTPESPFLQVLVPFSVFPLVVVRVFAPLARPRKDELLSTTRTWLRTCVPPQAHDNALGFGYPLDVFPRPTCRTLFQSGDALGFSLRGFALPGGAVSPADLQVA